MAGYVPNPFHVYWGNADLDGTLQDDCTEGEYFFMTSSERREARYQRRKAKRQAKREARCAALGPHWQSV